MLTNDIVFDSSNEFEILAVERTLDVATIHVQGTSKFCKCPYCNRKSLSVHSFYFRKVRDLPVFGNKVCIHLKTRKFYCYNPNCDRRVFAERFKNHFAPYKRSSDRLREKLLKIALLSGGNAGVRLCKILSIPVSSSTLIRLIYDQELKDPVPSEALGIDDWAYKKGINYGTAIVDLKRHKIIDLLPDREALSVQQWLKTRPGIKVITRDRFSRYAKAVTEALPKATQVADRWHLIKNMGDALQKLLERKRQEMRVNARLSSNASAEAYAESKVLSKVHCQPLSRRQLQMNQIKHLSKEGYLSDL